MDLFATFPPRMLSLYVSLVDDTRRERLFRAGVEKLKAYPEWARENFRVSDAEDVAYLRVSESAVEQLDTTYVAGLIGVEISEKDSRGIKAMKLRTCFAQKPVDDRFVSSDYNSRALNAYFMRNTRLDGNMLRQCMDTEDGFIDNESFSEYIDLVVGMQEAEACLLSKNTTPRERLAAYLYVYNFKGYVAEYTKDLKNVGYYLTGDNSGLRSKALTWVDFPKSRSLKRWARSYWDAHFNRFPSEKEAQESQIRSFLLADEQLIHPHNIGTGVTVTSVAEMGPSTTVSAQHLIGSANVTIDAGKDLEVPLVRNELWRVYFARVATELFHGYDLSKLDWNIGDTPFDFLDNVTNFLRLTGGDRYRFISDVMGRLDPGIDSDVMSVEEVPPALTPTIRQLLTKYMSNNDVNSLKRNRKFSLCKLCQMTCIELPEAYNTYQNDYCRQAFDFLVEKYMENRVD